MQKEAASAVVESSAVLDSSLTARTMSDLAESVQNRLSQSRFGGPHRDHSSGGGDGRCRRTEKDGCRHKAQSCGLASW